MEIKDIIFNLPKSNLRKENRLSIDLEATFSIGRFIDYLKRSEVLPTNKPFNIEYLDGNPIDNHVLFGDLKEREFNIIDLTLFPDDINPIPPQQFHQLGIFVLDGSGSMAEKTKGGITKSDAVNEAIRGLLTKFKVSKYANNFSFAIVNFDHNATTHTLTTAATDIDDNRDYNPMLQHGGGTNIMSGLSIAQGLAEDHMSKYQPGDSPHSVIILIMTDGEDFNKSESLKKAEEIKNGAYGGQITLCTSYFEATGNADDSGKEHLKKIATDRTMGYKEVYDAETLRNFFVASISRASGVNPQK